MEHRNGTLSKGEILLFDSRFKHFSWLHGFRYCFQISCFVLRFLLLFSFFFLWSGFTYTSQNGNILTRITHSIEKLLLYTILHNCFNHATNTHLHAKFRIISKYRRNCDFFLFASPTNVFIRLNQNYFNTLITIFDECVFFLLFSCLP